MHILWKKKIGCNFSFKRNEYKSRRQNSIPDILLKPCIELWVILMKVAHHVAYMQWILCKLIRWQKCNKWAWKSRTFEIQGKKFRVLAIVKVRKSRETMKFSNILFKVTWIKSIGRFAFFDNNADLNQIWRQSLYLQLK